MAEIPLNVAQMGDKLAVRILSRTLYKTLYDLAAESPEAARILGESAIAAIRRAEGSLQVPPNSDGRLLKEYLDGLFAEVSHEISAVIDGKRH